MPEPFQEPEVLYTVDHLLYANKMLRKKINMLTMINSEKTKEIHQLRVKLCEYTDAPKVIEMKFLNKPAKTICKIKKK